MSNNVNDKSGISENNVSVTLLIVGIITMVVGLLCGFMFASDGYGIGFSMSIFLLWLLPSIIAGITLIGLSEVIKFLFHINIRLENKGYVLSHKTKQD